MGQYRVKIGSVDYGLALEVVDTGWDSILAQRRDTEGLLFSDEFKSELVIDCAALPSSWAGATNAERFDNLLVAESDCYVFEVVVEVYCMDEWSERWAGSFNSMDWKSNRDDSTISVKPKRDSADVCLKKEWKEIVNIFDVSPVVKSKPTYVGYELLSDSAPSIAPCADATPPVTPSGYCFHSVVQQWSGAGLYNCLWIFFRYTQEGTCDGVTPVPPDDYNAWTLLSGGCPGTPIYQYCEEGTRAVHSFRNGRMLRDVLEFLADETGCGLSVVSDFFNINPDATNPDNAAYDAALIYLQDLVVHQKSDIKRHDASNVSKPAAWRMRLQDLLADLKIMFNADFKILPGGVLRIEHISFFEAQAGPDYSAESYQMELQADKADIKRLTRFQYRDEQCNEYFAGYPIEIYCGEDEETRRLNLFSTDIAFITDQDNAESIGDDGFVLIATTPVDFPANTYDIIQDNRPLSWTELHSNYHRHQMAGAGKINDVDTAPLSIRKTRKQPAFTVTLCCEDEYDPAKFITTDLGEGEVVDSEVNLAQDTLTLSLRY